MANQEQEATEATEAEAEVEIEIEAEPANEAEVAAGAAVVELSGEKGSEAEQAPVPTSPLTLAITTLQQQKQETWDRLLRTAAEFDNYKKRSKRDVVDSTRRAEDRVVLDFLPIIDNLERALAHALEEDGLVDGVKMVHKQFLTTLEKYDIHPFDSVGQTFDPERHEAIQQMPSDQAAGDICNELQRGYIRGDRLVRPAMVVVSSGPLKDDPTPEQEPPETEDK